MKEYRLSWEYRSAFSGEWYPSARVASEGSDILDQHAKLSEWERTGEEPIRNVRLQERRAADWKTVA